MGELARRRNARDLWVSRGQLYAAGTGVVLLVGIAFGVGYRFGRLDRPPGGSEVDPVSDAALVEVLARVEANAVADGGVGRLTFPDALAGRPAGIGVADAPADADALARVSAGPDAPSPVGDAPPEGAVTVEIGRLDDAAEALALRDLLRSHDLPAWMGVELVRGHRVHRVAVGGFEREADARRVLPEIHEVVGEGRGRIVPLGGVAAAP